MEIGAMKSRPRIRHTLTFEERLAQQAERLHQQARSMPAGAARDDVLARARQAETAVGTNQWLSSTDHKPPDFDAGAFAAMGFGGRNAGSSDDIGEAARRREGSRSHSRSRG